MSWKLLSLNAEDVPALVGGVDLWLHKWLSQGEEPIEVAHPEHPEQRHRLKRYFVQFEGKVIEFAAGEVSPGAWLIYVSEEPSGKPSNLFIGLSLCCFAVAGLAIRFGTWSSPSTLILIIAAVGAGAILGVASVVRSHRARGA